MIGKVQKPCDSEIDIYLHRNLIFPNWFHALPPVSSCVRSLQTAH
jgi:hypothetical protein